ncbi:MAG: S8 family serine peptidase, partial [Bacteroidota bacterium]
EIEEVRHLHPDLDDDKLNRTYQIRLNDIYKVNDVISKLKKHEAIEYAELKELHYTTLTPNDPSFDQTNQWALFQIAAEQAWDFNTGDPNIVVAVTDNAINVDHPDLTNKMVGGYDAVDQDNDPRPCGSNSGFHGSHVSGIVGAETDNSTGIASIGYDVSVLPVKIGDCTGALTAGYDGIVYAANNGADVINMSWGGGGSTNYGQNVCTNAWNAGSILVAAAGNDGTNQQFYPAAYNDVVSVASTNQNDEKSGFSQYGTWIDISAPGSNILSTDEGSGYQTTQGTSMASPLVAGLVGLMKSHAPNATQTDLLNCLYSSADDIDAQNPGYVGELGAGRINADAAMNCASSFSAQNDAAIVEIIEPLGSICSNGFTPEVVLRNYGSATLTSVTITYDWNGSPQTFSWTGSLASGATENVVLPAQTGTSGNYTFEAETSNPNGVADQNPANDLFTENFSLNGNGQIVDLQLDLDCYGSEISWEITDDNNGNAVVESGGGYQNSSGIQTISDSFCLAAGCYTFTINDSYGDGMNGSQEANCSVDGDYQMTDGNGNLLFEMTAPNADFGSSAQHQFCISQPNNINDAGISTINEPSAVVCNSTITPEVVIRNFGNDPLTSATINYQTTGGTQTYAWTGNLSPNQTEVVTLPSIGAGTGNVTLSAYTSNPNGQTDDTPANDEMTKDYNVKTSAYSLPFTEDFETNVFSSGLWSVDNPDDLTTWELFTVGGITPGSQAAKMDFYNYQQSARRDGLISPKLNFGGYSSVDLTFDHAYRRENQNAADSLIIYVSTDCGDSWNREFAQAEDGTGSFATQTTDANEFTPGVADDWCFSGGVGASCFTVNLDAYAGQEVLVKFESYNAGTIGNNLYVDNINIDGVPSGDPPTPDFNADDTTICEGGTVNFTDQSTTNITSWNWTFPGGNPGSSTAQNPSVTYNTAGTYDVVLEVTNNNGTETTTFTNEITVNTQPTVSITAPNTTICEGQSVQLAASGASSYSWDNGLGSGSSKTVSPQTTTTYQVVGSNGAGCDDTESVTITVESAPIVNATTSQSSICPGQSATLNASGANTYTWDNGLGAGASHTVSPTTSTIYNVTGETASGCTNTTSVAVTVEENPTVSVSASSTTICNGDSTVLTGSGGNSYTWSPGTGLNAVSGANVTATPGSTTTYTVEGTNSCGTDSESITVNVLSTPAVPSITQSGNVLSVNLQPGESAEWFLNGSSIGTGNSITMTQSGQYTVTVTNEDGCSTSGQGNFELDTTSLDEQSLTDLLQVYPNPTSGMVNISIKGFEQDVELSIIDALGRKVLDTQSLNAQESNAVNLRSFETGVYTLIFRSEGQMITRKVTLK